MPSVINEAQCATAFRPPWWARLHPNRWEGYLYRALSDRTVGGEAVPLSWTSAKFGERSKSAWSGVSARFCDDAFTIGLWYTDSEQMEMMVSRPTLHQFIRWYLWQWAAHEWCGLRRWLWYRLLHRQVNRTRRLSPLTPKAEQTTELPLNPPPPMPADDMAPYVRRLREEMRRQGVDLSRLGGT